MASDSPPDEKSVEKMLRDAEKLLHAINTDENFRMQFAKDPVEALKQLFPNLKDVPNREISAAINEAQSNMINELVSTKTSGTDPHAVAASAAMSAFNTATAASSTSLARAAGGMSAYSQYARRWAPRPQPP
jgi:hypothetical protein